MDELTQKELRNNIRRMDEPELPRVRTQAPRQP